MRQRILRLVSIAAAFFTVSLSICAQSQFASGYEVSITCDSGWVSPKASSIDTRKSPIFIFHTDEFWLNLHHFLYVLGRRPAREAADSIKPGVKRSETPGTLIEKIQSPRSGR